MKNDDFLSSRLNFGLLFTYFRIYEVERIGLDWVGLYSDKLTRKKQKHHKNNPTTTIGLLYSLFLFQVTKINVIIKVVCVFLI